MIKLKSLKTRLVQLTYGDVQVASMPCVTDSDVDSAKQILLHYLSSLDSVDDYRVSVTDYEVVTKSFL